MSANIFDIVIFFILTVSSLLGFYRGFVYVTINWISVLASILAAYWLYPVTKDFISKHVGNEVVLVTLSSTISYLICAISTSLISNKLINILQAISGGVVDRFFGLVTGFLRGSVICLILSLTIIIITTNAYIKANNALEIFESISKDKYPTWVNNSLSIKYIDNSLAYVVDLLPKDTLQSITLPLRHEYDDDSATGILKRARKKSNSQEDPVGDAKYEDLEQEINDMMP